MDYKKIAEEFVKEKNCLNELTIGCKLVFNGWTHDEQGNLEKQIPLTGIVIGDGFYGSLEVITTDVVNDDWRNIQYDVKLGEITEVIGHPILPHHWLKALRTVIHANWMLASVGDNFELIDMTDYALKKFKNRYMIIGHENFYRRFCEELGLV